MRSFEEMKQEGEASFNDKIIEKARNLASCDKSLNGDYLNAPYKIWHEGMEFIARVRTKYAEIEGYNKTVYYLVIEQTMIVIGQSVLP